MGIPSLIATLVALEVTGGGYCPSPAELSERLGVLLPKSNEGPADRALVEATDTSLRVELRSSDGRTIASRILPSVGSCSDRADTVAATIAAWESNLSASSPLAVELPGPIGPILVRPARPARQVAWNLGVGFLGSIAGGAFAPGAIVDASLGKRGFPLAARLGLAGTDGRDLALGQGHATWNRWALFTGPTLNLPAGPLRVTAHGDLVAGWLFVQGQGYPKNHGSDSFDVAAGGGVRLSVARWAAMPWLDLTLLGWLRQENAVVAESGPPLSAEIPRFDIWLTAGLAYGSGR